ncbi:hypothetical protein [Nitrincola alkalilacustris]|nr:hypothetical protein [Nitrincola alkalilacustris]
MFSNIKDQEMVLMIEACLTGTREEAAEVLKKQSFAGSCHAL